MDTSNLLLLLLMFLRYAKGSNSSCVKILPDSSTRISLELGTKFTATCYLQEGSRYTSDDIEWTMADVTISKQLYHKINETAVSVTVDISSETSGWLKCETRRNSFPYMDSCVYGIDLHPGYRPLKPTNFTCIALQKDRYFSSDLTCYWDPGARDPELRTTYILYAEIPYDKQFKEVCEKTPPGSCTVNLSTFPVHMDLKVWLEVSNALGTEKSEELIKNSANFVKPNPPLDIKVLSEVNFSTTLFITWKDPMDRETLKLLYAIRYCQAGSGVWIEVPENITQDSFRLQNLNPDTEYVVQMRSTGKRDGTYWSDWSANVTARTAEAKPASPPDLWRIIQKTSSENRKVTFLWKPPVKANGKILDYSLVTTKDYNTTERHLLKADNFSQMYSMELQRDEIVNVEISARNSAGESPNASLFISRQNYEYPGVANMNWRVHDGKLQVEWSAVPPHLHKGARLSEYLLEWQNENELQPNWQRVPANVNNTTITGDLTDFKRYSLSVYPVYKHYSQLGWHFQAGKPKTKPAYIRQGSPEEGPVSDAKYKKNSAVLTWKEIPVNAQRGFIKNYTVFYKPVNADKWTSDTVAANIHEYVLTDLLSERDYVVRIMASTEAGSNNGSDLTFKTLKYGDGEVEVIVVLVCLGFLFLSVFIIMLCLRKREVIKKLLWPQVPDPSDSSIAHWSPDFPVKADMPKEDVSVVEVDVFDRKSLCEEDKGVLPLKKDKYLSEEHSSGIGGSSCMSSPRHSVSDSDEGDSGQTTASTVQYSSVLASGYKGQTPNHQPVFARSESTQPLLDCEEHPDHLSESHGRNSYFRRGRELEPGVLVQECDEPNKGSLTFCPVQEEASPDVEDPPTDLSYMPQKSGYRPQQN